MEQHMYQVLANGFGRHRAQVELEAARQHRHGYLLRIGGGQHKLEVVGRLFQRFQHGVECGPGQHVHLVDHEYLETPLHGLVNGLFQQGLHIVYAAIGRRVEFRVVDKTPSIDIRASLADATGLGSNAARSIRPQTIQRLGQNPRYRRLAHAPRTGEQVGMVQPLRIQRIRQRSHHVFLPYHLREILRTVLAGEHEVGHATILVAGYG
jgi:hypothetical protein